MLLHVDLVVRDIERSMQFYRDALEMQVKEDSWVSGDIVRYMSEEKYTSYRLVLLKFPIIGTMLELLEYTGHPSVNDGSNRRVYNLTFLVSSLEETISKLAGWGFTADSELFEVNLPHAGRSKIIFYKDPDDNLIELLEMKK